MKKIRLLELTVSVLKETFITDQAGVWMKTMSVVGISRPSSPIETIFSATWDDALPDYLVDIGAVHIDGISFNRVNAKADLYTNDTAWYFDPDVQVLYIAFTDYTNTIVGNEFDIGEKLGLASEAQNELINGVPYPVNSYYNGFLYTPRLLDTDVAVKTDDQSNGIFVFDELAASIMNADGVFDNIRESITGNDIQLLVADISESIEEEIESGIPYKLQAEYDDFHIVRKGVLESVDYNDPDEPSLKAIDIRSDWDQKISDNLLTVAEFPNLEDKYVDKRKPVCIGKVNGAKGIQLQENSDTAIDFDYLICDTSIGDIQSVSGVYFDGQLDISSTKTEVDRYLTGSEYEIDLETGVLTVYDCYKGKVWVYGVFTEMNETTEIILYLLNQYANLAYLDINYNQTEIEAVQSLDYQTHVYIDEKGKKLSDVIEKLVMDIQMDFFQQGDVFTLRKANEQRAVTQDISAYDIVDNPPGWDDNRIETIKTISVSYDPDYREDISPIWYDDSLESVSIENNRKPVDRTFETNLVNSADVDEIYTVYYERFVNQARVVQFTNIFPFIAKLTDFIAFPIVRKRNDTGDDKEIFTKGIYKIIELDEIENSCTCVYFDDSPAEEVYTVDIKMTPDGYIKYTPFIETTQIDQLTPGGYTQETPGSDIQQLPYGVGGEIQYYIEKG